MEVRIGIKHSPREITFETESTAEQVRELIEGASAKDGQFVSLSDVKGRQYLVDTDSIAFIELGGDAGRKVGFIS